MEMCLIGGAPAAILILGPGIKKKDINVLKTLVKHIDFWTKMIFLPK